MMSTTGLLYGLPANALVPPPTRADQTLFFVATQVQQSSATMLHIVLHNKSMHDMIENPRTACRKPVNVWKYIKYIRNMKHLML